jgi:hypothetical protein
MILLLHIATPPPARGRTRGRTRQRRTLKYHLCSAYLVVICTWGTNTDLRSTTSTPSLRHMRVRTPRMLLAKPWAQPLQKTHALLLASAPSTPERSSQALAIPAGYYCPTPLTTFGVFSIRSSATLPPNSRRPSLLRCLRTGRGATRTPTRPNEVRPPIPTLSLLPLHPQPHPQQNIHLPLPLRHNWPRVNETSFAYGENMAYKHPGALYVTDRNF